MEGRRQKVREGRWNGGFAPYGRRSNEKIQGTRNEYHIVKQDEYDLFDGAHEAIISENDFRLAAQKRKETQCQSKKESGWHLL